LFLGKRILLIPTEEQIIMLKKSCGCSKFVYNWYLNFCFKRWKKNQRRLTYVEGCKQLIELKQKYHWLCEVSNYVLKQSIRDADAAFKLFALDKKWNKPRYKNKYSKNSFYVRCEKNTFYEKNGKVKCEKIGMVQISRKLPLAQQYYNVRISNYCGKWYISVAYEVEEHKKREEGISIGIDLGLKDLAILSTGKKYKNINKEKKIKYYEKKLRREQNKLSRKLKANIKYRKNNKPKYKRPLDECKNYQKQRLKVQRIYKRLKDIRENYIHKITIQIVKNKYVKRVVMEDLDIQQMLKNKYLSKSILVANWYKFRSIMEYKCKLYGIEFVLADRYFPSTQKCSVCGNVRKGKDKLTLKDRQYHCCNCNANIDRDVNASINLANYI